MTSGTARKYPSNVKYAATHEWALPEGEVLIVGISDYAQDALGDVVLVDLVEVGTKLAAGDSFGVVESVKAASDVYAPVSGIVESVNQKLTEKPEIVNEDPFGEGWMIRLRPAEDAEPGKLMDAKTYRGKIEAGELH